MFPTCRGVMKTLHTFIYIVTILESSATESLEIESLSGEDFTVCVRII